MLLLGRIMTSYEYVSLMHQLGGKVVLEGEVVLQLECDLMDYKSRIVTFLADMAKLGRGPCPGSALGFVHCLCCVRGLYVQRL